MTRLTTLALLAAAALAACGVTPALATAQDGGKPPMTEAAFIELAGAPQAGDPGGRSEPGRPHEPAKGTEEPKAKKEEDSAGDDDAAGSADDAAGSDDGEGEEDDEDAEDTADDDDAGEEGDAGSADDGDDGEADDDTGDDPEDEESPDAAKGRTGGKGGKKDQKTLDAEFQAALEAEGASLSLDDVPAAVRPLVEKKIKNLEAGFTRAMQQVRADQKSAATFRAEELFRKDKPVDFIVSMLLDNPDLAEGVNTRIGELEGNATAVEGHKALVEKARREASTTVEGEATKADQNAQRVERFVTLGRAAAKAAGVPFDMGVEEGIAAHLLLHGDISEAEIRKIASTKASIYQRQLRQDRRDRSGKYVDNKVADRKKAGLRVKPGQGSAPAPAGKKVAKNDAEFIAEFSGRQ